MIPTVNSFTLSSHLPYAQLIIYPDSGHGSLFQHAGAYTSHVSEFLDRK
jgi:pimeloyl-ACP methyl ester carboxylesterase